jgi:hypothetical protein
MPPWWLPATLGPSITLLSLGVGLLAARPMNFADPWVIAGWTLLWGGGGYAIVLGLFYLRWRGEEAYTDRHGRRWRRRDIDRLPAAELTKLAGENRDLLAWWQEDQPGLHRPVIGRRRRPRR